MTHQAQAYIQTLLPTTPSKIVIESLTLNQSEARVLLKYLKSDAVSYIYSATISVGDAIIGVNKQLFTWATVKLYYATFYALRALLALDNICIFYIGTKPYLIEVKAGKCPQKRDGQTHKVVLDEFSNRNTEPSLLSQEIDLEKPLDWLMIKREEANYKIAKFYEPNIPEHFKKIAAFGVRQSIKEYLLDKSDLYLFDQEHAILAYPLRSIQLVYKKIRATGNFELQDDEINYLCQLFNDKNGPIPESHKMLRE